MLEAIEGVGLSDGGLLLASLVDSALRSRVSLVFSILLKVLLS